MAGSQSLSRRLLATRALLPFAALSACAVGPNFKAPTAPSISHYTERALPARTGSARGPGGAAQHFALGATIEGDWWQLFHSRELDRLIATSLRQNPSLDAAQNTLLAAEEAVRAQQGALLPAATGSLQAAREHGGTSSTSGTSQTSTGTAARAAGFTPTYSVLDASVAVSYAPDIFGGVRRQVESARAAAEAQRFALEAAYLSLTSNVVTAWIQDASLVERIRVTRQIIGFEQQVLTILQRQVALGGAAEASVLTQRAQLESTRATLPPLEKQLAQTRDQLAAYEGTFPQRFHAQDFDLASLSLPGRLPVSLPSSLVEQRPDIRQAAAVLHEQTANVGIATANLLPQITLTASYGRNGLSAAQLFTPQGVLWNLVAGLTQPIFEGGTLRAKQRQAIATMRAAAADYRNTVVLAFQNVADTLVALQYDASTLAADQQAERAAKSSLDLTRRQYRLGAVPFTAVLSAEQTYQSAVIARVQATAQRYADTAALFAALGGGWWHRHDVAEHVRNCCKIVP